MRVFRFAVLIALVVLGGGVSMAAFAQGRVAKDPNTPGASGVISEKKEADSRLARSVTYTSGQKRLHDVVDELTAITGVKLRAGNNTQDWQIRDIPVVVAVKDISLGRLLRALAESTHTSLVAEKAPNSDKPTDMTYRFHRTKKNDYAAQLKAEHARQIEDAGWAWDAAIALGKHPEALKNSLQTKESIALLGQLMATLGPGAKSKVLAGDPVSVEINNSSREIFRQLHAANNAIHTKPGKPAAEVSEETLDSSVLTLKLTDGGDSSSVDIWASLAPTPGSIFLRGLRTDTALLRLQSVKALNLPARPYSNEVLGSMDSAPSPDLERMVFRCGEPVPDISGKEWTQPELTSKVKLTLPEKKIPTFADEITAIANETGYSIVTEDFTSHKCGFSTNLKDKFGREARACDLLNEACGTWFADKNSKLLLGWAGVVGNWRSCHANMVPESFVAKLAAKVNTEMELDDLVPVVSLTAGQRWDWVLDNVATWWTVRGFRCDLTPWQLYDTLTPEEKKLAKSPGGLALSTFDAADLNRFLKSARETSEQAAFPRAGNEAAADSEKSLPKDLLNPQVLRTAVMRVISEPTERLTEVDLEPVGNMTDREAALKWYSQLHTYYMEMEYTVSGEVKKARFDGLGFSFPIVSMKKFCKPAGKG